MAWRVEFLPAADKAFGKLDRQYQRRIQKFIETRLQTGNDPHGRGEAYTGPLNLIEAALRAQRVTQVRDGIIAANAGRNLHAPRA